jgi:tRNA modification GTPase
VATPPGRGGIGVLRISGDKAKSIAAAMLGKLPAPRHATLAVFRDRNGKPLDSGLALFFPAPHSFTGEDVVELQGHGGAVILDMVLARVIELGARLAQPGEFSQRAFLNDKLDLVQAEAIADLIDSGSQQAARAALRSLNGDFSARANELTQQLIDARIYVEAAIDFPEEEVDFLADAELQRRLNTLVETTKSILSNAQQGALLRDGMTVVIAGRPNAGKSSLLNALAGYEAAIVTPIAGTTRDLLRERIAIDGMPLHLIDTAGLRETHDVVESEGIRRAHVEMSKADRILYIVDSESNLAPTDIDGDLAKLPNGIDVTLVYNKIDREPHPRRHDALPSVCISARTGAGLGDLHSHLKKCMGLQESSATTFSARRRHLEALREAEEHVDAAIRLLQERKAGELVAEELRLAQREIDEITGEFTSDDLLGKIFSSFCIGK